MQIGFNHNFKYKEVVCHVQTEDGGPGNPVITTHLFKDGGTIFATSRASYAEFLKDPDCEEKVRALMREQTTNLLKELKTGKFDHMLAAK